MLDFQEMYEAYAEEIFRFAFWLAGDQMVAEDITSETLIRAWVRSGAIRTQTLKAYLLQIARNLFLERQRKGQNQIFLNPDFPDSISDPERLVQTRLELMSVETILQKLPEIDRSAFILRVKHALPYVEIARVLSISVTNARVKVHRVRKQLLASRIEKEV